MGMFSSLNISGTALTAERTRMDVITKNIANANTTRTSSGKPYRRQMPLFREIEGQSFSALLNKENEKLNDKKGVKITAIVEDRSPFKKVYNPGHPDSDKDGYVLMPNVDIVTEMVDMISASRAYEANMTAINSAKSMAMKALEIGR
ncbi:flagellar basal body rod protein FlgC [Gottschalkia acidurici 9a]|uniref:Flagellar basal-body rod protein FlgC n=1 Tax=Gottschalkia acidurici (strain ATCC 7906 / DSM 604 / BCRC 14475 / CIP 104303 / KCTC 5404 / NCIMB 10678 / 9a) TaxID=1128398 RepID=K0AZB9_GOTA9|nr:flagellar basal body rod protein FlgC [Gottschalkia acidurici]AFS78614.1 flagellar basal body rod protein FlgC [Gottschalkia acidurici 9a]